MKSYPLILLLSCLAHILSAQETMKINSLEEGKKQYTFSGRKDTSSIQITIAKNNEYAELSPLNSQTVWIGKNNPYMRYSDITITFSQPVTSASFYLSHFNHDQTGDEQISKFKVFDTQGTNLSASSNFEWLTGEASGNSTSIEAATEFDKEKRIIKATYQYGSDVAAGRLVVSNTAPFTKITLRYEVIDGTPNGFHIDGDIGITLPIPPQPVIVKEEKKDSSVFLTPIAVTPIDSVAKDVPSEKIVVASVDSIKKETPVLVKEKKTEPVVKKTVPIAKKTTPAKTTSKTTATKKITPSTSVAKKSTSTSKTSTSKSTNTKPVVKKAAVKKTTPPPTQVKKEVVPEKVHEFKEIKLMQVGEKVKLNKVFFKQSLPELLPESYPQLDTLVMILKELPTMEIELQGHTDNQGDPRLNLQLSEQRVATVKKYLVNKGIAANRLTEKGFGGNKAAVTNDTEENRKKNRRVEFMITKR